MAPILESTEAERVLGSFVGGFMGDPKTWAKTKELARPSLPASAVEGFREALGLLKSCRKPSRMNRPTQWRSKVKEPAVMNAMNCEQLSLHDVTFGRRTSSASMRWKSAPKRAVLTRFLQQRNLKA